MSCGRGQGAEGYERRGARGVGQVDVRRVPVGRRHGGGADVRARAVRAGCVRPPGAAWRAAHAAPAAAGSAGAGSGSNLRRAQATLSRLDCTHTYKSPTTCSHTPCAALARANRGRGRSGARLGATVWGMVQALMGSRGAWSHELLAGLPGAARPAPVATSTAHGVRHAGA